MKPEIRQILAASVTRRSFLSLSKASMDCHPERVRESGAIEDESKDPENVFSAMLIQGVSTTNVLPPRFNPENELRHGQPLAAASAGIGARLQPCRKAFKWRRALAPAVVFLLIGGAISLIAADRDSKPQIQLNVSNAAPREVEDTTQQAIVRDYGLAWQALERALAGNTTAPLNENFIGYALDSLTRRVKDQQRSGLTTRIVDRGHKVDAVFYSPDGSAMELRDLATLETQVLEGSTVIHSEQSQVVYYAVMTGAEDRWKVRVLQSAEK